MRPADLIGEATRELLAHPLRSSVTLLGIAAAVTFLVAVLAVIDGLNGYVRDTIADALVGTNTFQVRRLPIRLGPILSDDRWAQLRRRPTLTARDARAVTAALPDAEAIGLQSGWPIPQEDMTWRGHVVRDVLVIGITAPYQVVRDCRFVAGQPLTDLDVARRRDVAVIGGEVADGLFDRVNPVGRTIRVAGRRITIVGVVARKGRVLGRSFDGFVLLPLSTFELLYGSRGTMTISVKMRRPEEIRPAMLQAEEALRVARRLRPSVADNFEIETSDAVVDYYGRITRLLFQAVPAIMLVGIAIGGVTIMNVLLVTLVERTREVGMRRAVGAWARHVRVQFLCEACLLSGAGGVCGVAAGVGLTALVRALSPLPARVMPLGMLVGLVLGLTAGVVFGSYPAIRAGRLDPAAALRTE